MILPSQEWVYWSAAGLGFEIIDHCINQAEKQKEDPMALIQVEMNRLKCHPHTNRWEGVHQIHMQKSSSFVVYHDNLYM